MLLFGYSKFAFDVSPKAIVRFNYLKLLSESVGQTEQALTFNALELYAKRHSSAESIPFKVGTWLYEKLSDYGRSFGRPLLCYSTLLLITWFIALNSAMFNVVTPGVYLSLDAEGVKSTECKEFEPCDFRLTAYRAATEYTLYRAVGVLDFADDGKKTTAVNQRLFGKPFEPALMRFWGVFKAIAGTALLFLVALGLRNRYRLK